MYIRTLIAQTFVIISLALGRFPHVIALLDLLQQPPVARVIITRRRRLDYTEFFSSADRDGRRAAPITHLHNDHEHILYRWADTA